MKPGQTVTIGERDFMVLAINQGRTVLQDLSVPDLPDLSELARQVRPAPRRKRRERRRLWAERRRELKRARKEGRARVIETKLCTSCHSAPRRSSSQRWCKACHNASARQHRRKYHELSSEHRRRANARSYLNVYVSRGIIHRGTICEACGKDSATVEIQAHHADYDKPLDVNWLCVGCHVMFHMEHEVKIG